MSSARQGWIVLLIVAGALLLAAIGLALWLSQMPGQPTVGRRTVLELDLSEAIPEQVPEDPITLALLGRPKTVRGVVEALDRAAADDRVVALVAKVAAAPMGLARIQELRQAVQAFARAGKPAIAWAETFGEFTPANGAYYLATGFDEIHLQPSGDVGLTGLRFETPFYRGALDKLGVVPQVDRRREYKTGANAWMERELTAEHAETLASLAESQLSQIAGGIATGRSLDAEDVLRLVDRGPFYGGEAVEAGLVDSLAYRDEVYEGVRRRFDDEVTFLPLERYRDRGRGLSVGGTGVALVFGVGTVSRGASGFHPLTGDQTMGSDTVGQAFRDAVDDPDIEAILFRVDSPGGSYVASDTIWRETIKAREAGKPVVVSMGDLAGSGGYFVAMAADHIVAQPGTLTGSIGVYGGKLVTEATWRKLGITWGAVSAGERAGMWSSLSEFSPGEWERMQRLLDRIYDDFTAKVGEGRGLDPERVEEVARGRVWTGQDALEVGLVDELGGLPQALAAVRRQLGLAEGARLRLEVFPKPRSPLELLRERRSWLAGFGARLAPLLEAARRLGLLDPVPAPLEMPPMEAVP